MTLYFEPGQTFPGSRLTVIKRAGSNKFRNWMWLCRCECGNEKVVIGHQLNSGYIRSCGCLKQETNAAQGAQARRTDLSQIADEFKAGKSTGEIAKRLGLNKERVCQLIQLATGLRPRQLVGNLPRRLCANPECGMRFPPRSNRSTVCSPACGLRVAYIRKRKEAGETYLPRRLWQPEDLTKLNPFDNWTALRIDRTNRTGNQIHWWCRCVCGAVKSVSGQNLKRHLTKSCGCRAYTEGKQFGHAKRKAAGV